MHTTSRRLMAALAAAGVLALPRALSAQGDGSARARMAIDAEVRAFYESADARDWNSLLTHFWPAKVAARWEPPLTDSVWVALRANAGHDDVVTVTAAVIGSGAARARLGCVGRVDVAVVGSWARVLASPCVRAGDGRRTDELWLLAKSGQWKIVHLAAPSTP
jgi:hypothetical protein